MSASSPLSKEQVIEKIANKTELYDPFNTFLPLTAISKHGAQFQRVYNIKGQVNKGLRTIEHHEYEVNAIVRLDSPTLQTKQNFIHSISIREVADTVDIKYRGSKVSPQ